MYFNNSQLVVQLCKNTLFPEIMIVSTLLKLRRNFNICFFTAQNSFPLSQENLLG